MTNENEQLEIIEFNDNDISRTLFGQQNQNLKAIEEAKRVQVNSRGGEVSLQGPSERILEAVQLLNQLYELVEKQFPLKPSDVKRAAKILEDNPKANLAKIFLDKISIGNNGKRAIAPKTIAQKIYLDAIRHNDLTFSIGPAGTGKTYLSMSMAVSALLHREFKRIVLTRPAVEAGEKLGFLPGDLAEKINPYLRPLYDALFDLVEIDKARDWMQNGTVEVAPLAFMRGRTLNNSFIILDEAQNTTTEQMKMFLTRMGNNSKAVVTGDITQIDLPTNSQSGLIHATRILSDVEGIAVCKFSKVDVVRHPLVQKIVEAYEDYGDGQYEK